MCRKKIIRSYPPLGCGVADNPYSLKAIYRRRNLAVKADKAVYVTRCASVGVVPPSNKNCTEEIPVLHNGTEIFVDPISYVIKSTGSPVHCNDVAPLTINLVKSGTAATLT
jgi:hypothetical protein